MKKRQTRAFFKRLLILLAVLTVLLVFAAACFRFANTHKYALDGKDDVDINGYFDINGVEQYLRIKGEDEDNPVMLFMHGGPGNPLSCVSYTFTHELYDDFTVCEWDQRGCGRTYFNEKEPPSADELLADIGCIIDLLQDELETDKVILAGYSWGSVIGLEYAAKQPGDISAYIGVGQCVSIERVMENNMEEYLKVSDDPAEAMEEYAALTAEGGDAMEHFSHYRKLAAIFSKELGETGRSGMYYFLSTIAGPDTNMRDLGWKMIQGMAPWVYMDQVGMLAQHMYLDFDAHEIACEIDCPVLFITGENDVTMPSAVVGEFYEELDAPKKEFVVIEDAGHSVIFDRPDVFADVVREFME